MASVVPGQPIGQTVPVQSEPKAPKSFFSRVYTKVTGALSNTKVLACADKVAMCAQNIAKLAKCKPLADSIKSARISIWGLLSKQAVQKEGFIVKSENRDFYKGFKEEVDSLNSLEMLI